MIRLYLFYVKGVGALFVGLGLLTIFAPTGAPLLLLGVAMLLAGGAVSLAEHAARGSVRAAHAIASAWQGRQPLRVPIPAVRHRPAPERLRPLHR